VGIFAGIVALVRSPVTLAVFHAAFSLPSLHPKIPFPAAGFSTARSRSAAGNFGGLGGAQCGSDELRSEGRRAGPAHTSTSVDAPVRRPQWSADRNRWPTHPIEQPEQALGNESASRGVNVLVALGLLAMRKEPLRHN